MYASRDIVEWGGYCYTCMTLVPIATCDENLLALIIIAINVIP